ncbi:hypothetical protein BASA81_007380 [Batrachochytrium salamandrivorans]|nr:hypothetical protein BASA81_007380 [Batrachochytrium salamandrivorans]
MAWRDSFVVKPSLRVKRSDTSLTSSRQASQSISTQEQDNHSLLELERKTHHARRNQDDSVFSGTSFAESSSRDASTQGFLRHVTFAATFEESTPPVAASPTHSVGAPEIRFSDLFPNEEEEGEENPRSSKHKSLFTRTMAELPERGRALSVKLRKSQSTTSMTGNKGGEEKDDASVKMTERLSIRLRNISVHMRGKIPTPALPAPVKIGEMDRQ